ncbi:MAG: TolC family protein [Sulfurospirillum sp.]|nr:TolC family protein [Sulfurospirillum sp.]
MLFWLTCTLNFLFASSVTYTNLPLEEALQIVKKENLELRVALFNEQIKEFEYQIAKGYNYGKLDLTQLALRSNDAGNVFGFKLQSREASFADFGFAEFLAPLGQVLEGANQNALPAGFSSNLGTILDIQPKDLNYPDARNHFQTKLSYQVPLYTGGKLEQYGKITQALIKLSKLDTKQILNEKIFQVKKSYFDIFLLDAYLKNLTLIDENIRQLEDMAQNMIAEGYAKKVDLLEVQSKRANVTRMINKAHANKELVYQFLSFLLNVQVQSIAGTYANLQARDVVAQSDLQNNIDIQKAKQGLAITKMAIDLQKASNLPEIGAFAEYGSSDNQFLNNFAKHDAYTVGVQLKWNLFNGGIDKNNIEKARVENLKVQTQLNLAQNGIALHVAKIRTEIKSFDFDIESLHRELELTRVIYKNYLGRYQEKLVSINDVIIKQSMEIENILKLKELQNARSSKILELEKIVNGDEV